MNTELNNKIEKYAELQAQMEVLKTQLDELKPEIIEGMVKESVDKIELPSGVTAQVVTKETFKYDDELGMINYLKANGLTSFIVEKVNTTAMNKELKKGLTLTESLKPMFTKTYTNSLTVKKAV